MNIARVYQGFISIGPFMTGGPEGYFADVSTTTFVVKSCLYNTQTLILDAVVVSLLIMVYIMLVLLELVRQIYRTYVVWQNFLVVVVPIIGWCGLLGKCQFCVITCCANKHPAGSIGLNVALATASSHKSDVFAAQTGQWITSVYGLTLATNLSSTRTSLFVSYSLSQIMTSPPPHSAPRL